MKDKKICEVYDEFRLDDETWKTVLENIWAEAEKGEKKPIWRRTGFKKVAVAACAVLLIGFGSVAYALGWFGLKDISTGKNDKEVTLVRNGNKEKVIRQSEVLSLGGVKGTPEYEAFAEWNTYWWSYIEEHKDSLTNDPVTDDGYYSIYNCWFPEMKEKLDEILAKYDLEPHKSEQFFEMGKLQEICEAAGIDSIFPDMTDHIWDNGCYAYVYNDGTFYLESQYDIGAEEQLEFGITRCVYGTFNQLGMNIHDSDRFTEWQFTTSEGITVTVAEIREPYEDDNGETYAATALVMIGRPESMVTVQISPWTAGYYEIDGVRYADEDLPEGVIGTPQNHHWQLELPSREQIQSFINDMHVEIIP